IGDPLQPLTRIHALPAYPLHGSGSVSSSRVGFFPGSLVDFPCSPCIHDGDPESDDEIRPSRECYARKKPSQNDGCISQHVIAGREERSETEAPAVMANADKEHGARKINQQRTQSCHRERERCGWYRKGELLPCRPQCGQAWNQDE